MSAPILQRPGGFRAQTRTALCLTLLAAMASSCSSKFNVEAPASNMTLQERISPGEGAIVSVVGASVTRGYDSLSDPAQARFDEEVWEAARASLPGRADLVTYSSQGLRIGGFLVRPQLTDGRRVGAVVVNRDGIANLGLDEDEILVELSRYAEAGYVAATSAYRGNRLSQGVDQLGGDDVNDVLSMVSLLQRLDYVDPDRIFMVGFGRGGLMTLRALEAGAPVRAAAVVSAITDMEALAGTDPRIEAGFEEEGGWPGLASIHGPWEEGSRSDQLRRRSPGQRLDTLEVPLLVAHGRQDNQASVDHALGLVDALRRADVPFESVIYGYGDHALEPERRDWQARVLAWIQRHDSRALFN